MILQLLTCFLLWTAALIAAFEAYSWILHRTAFLPYKLLFGYLLYCVLGGMIFGLPIFGFERILGSETFTSNQPQIAIETGVFLTVSGSPIIAYLFFQRRHMASLKELGYFLPIKYP